MLFRPFASQLLFLVLLLCTPGLNAQEAPAQAVILQYHHVSTRTPPSTSTTPAQLRAHLEWLRDQGFSVRRLEDVVKALRQGQSLPDRTAVLTFDDGYLSVYEEAWPLLQEFGYPFTIFITAGLVTSNGKLYASWEQLREMGTAGATLANHTVTHPYFAERQRGQDDAAWLAWVRREIEDAEARILAETGQSHKLLAYPYGEYVPEIQALVQELGYVGIGQHSGPINAGSDFTALPRFPFGGIYASMNSFPVKVDSLAFDVKLVAPLTPLTDERSPSAELAFTGNYRLDALNCFNNDVPMQLELLDAATQRYRITTRVENRTRRFRYNCTAPGRDGRFYWYSVPFLNTAVADN